MADQGLAYAKIRPRNTVETAGLSEILFDKLQRTASALANR